MIKNYKQAFAYLESLMGRERDKDKEAGLKRMHALLDQIGNPQNAYLTVHVGGTAGKGSTSMMLSDLLVNAGYKTGLHVSPHLEDARERMQINGKLISESKFAELVNYVKPFAEKVQQESGCGWPSYFEVLIAITLECFRREKVDIAVVEVGMGGRYDGTNVINPLVAILTNVGLDHTEYLGNTVEKIAREKVGIFKPGVDVLSGVNKPSVVRIVREEAKRTGSKLYLLGHELKPTLLEYGQKSMLFNLRFGDLAYRNLELAALGEHQVANASLSVAAALLLGKHGFVVDEKAVRKTLKNTKLPGRFEILSRNPTVILDGAHNPMKVSALVSVLLHNYKNKKFRVVFAAKRGKDIKHMLRMIDKVADSYYFTKFEALTDFGRRMATDPAELQEHTRVRALAFSNSAIAYKHALRDAGRRGLICVTGSLYLVGELRTLLKRR